MRDLARRTAWLLYLTACLSLLVLPAANAYIDAGSGSFIFQAAIAFGLASAVAVKTQWRRVRSLFGRRAPRE